MPDAPETASPPSARSLRWFIAAALLAILAVHLAYALLGHPRYREQHLGGALHYAAHGVDLLHPVIKGFNATGTPTPLELPVWQAAAGTVMRAFGPWWGWGNVVSWLLFASCLPPFFLLARAALGPRAAAWSLLALLLQPLVFFSAGQASTDGTALAASIWFVFAAGRLLATGAWRWCLIAAALGALAATLKPPFFMAAGLATVGLLWAGPRRPALAWLQLALAGAFATGCFLLWARHADQQFARAEFPLWDLRLSTNPAMADWYFGTWDYRLDPVNWLRGAYRVLMGLCGSFPLILLVLVGLAQRPQNLARSWLVGAAVVTVVHTHLVLYHWNYYLMLAPAFALLGGGALAAAESFVATRAPRAIRLFPVAALAALTLALMQGLRGGHFFVRDDFPRQMAARIAAHTASSDRLLVANGGWGGIELILAGRDGLSLVDPRLVENPAALARLRALGYTKLVVLNSSPLRIAVGLLGGSLQPEPGWRTRLGPSSRAWPVIHADDDMGVLQIPAAGVDARP